MPLIALQYGTSDEAIINENTSRELTFTLLDYDAETGVSSEDITSVTMTLTDKIRGTVINSREDIDVSSYFDTDGNFEMNLSAADNPFVNESLRKRREIETHLLKFTITAVVSGETKTLTETIKIKVRNIYYT